MQTEPRRVRVLFAGGKAVGCGVLRSLIATTDVEVCGVIVNPNDTAPDRWFPSATEIATERAISVYAPSNINTPESIAWIQQREADLIVVAYYDQILAAAIFSMPRLGCVNLHLAKAEAYRGCYPTTWALINGETETGVTMHRVTAEIDGGDILAEREVPIAPDDTGRSLYDKCTVAGVELFSEALPALIAGTLEGRTQLRTMHTRNHNRQFPSHEIQMDGNACIVANRIRALTFKPFPPPYLKIGSRKFHIVEVGDSADDD